MLIGVHPSTSHAGPGRSGARNERETVEERPNLGIGGLDEDIQPDLVDDGVGERPAGGSHTG